VSEYQYYEFQAIDRPLTEKEMAELRSCSTRARITSTTFVNDYSWGNFKGDEDAWMEKYFDAFLYLANWGTHVFKLRLPSPLLDPTTASLYCVGDHVSVREKHGKMILTFDSEDEEGDSWVEGEGRLSALISIRAELARGDLRALYLGWLLCAQSGDLGAHDVEPPVPAGLATLSASLESLIEFLRIDTGLVCVAATASPELRDSEPNLAEVRTWIARLRPAERDDLLARLIVGKDGAVTQELVQRMRRRHGEEQEVDKPATKRRTVAELLDVAEQVAEERRRVATENAAREKDRRERQAAVARAKYLDQLAGRERSTWREVESLVATMQPKKYDHAVDLLVDLRDLAARNGGVDFRRRLEELRALHARKPSFVDRLRKARL
jgi:hypothetical protein